MGYKISGKMTKAEIIDYFTSLVMERDKEIADLTQLVDTLKHGGGNILIEGRPVIMKG